jgi:hypothetical protein
MPRLNRERLEAHVRSKLTQVRPAVLFDIESRRNRSGKAFLVQRDKREFITGFEGLKDVSAIVKMVCEASLRQKPPKSYRHSKLPA